MVKGNTPLRMREEPSTSAQEIGASRAARVEVLERGETWTKLRYIGQVGYSMSAYLTFAGEEPEQPEEPEEPEQPRSRRRRRW